MKKKILILMLASMMATSCVACGAKSSDKKNEASTSATEMVTETETETEQQIEEQDITADALTPLADAGVITGVKDITVAEGTDVKLNDLVYADNTIVKSVDVDDSAVDYSKAGTYDVIYTITFDGEALRDYVKDNNLKLDFDTDSDTIVVKTTVTVTVATKEDADAAIAAGNTDVVTTETKESVAKSNKAKANDNATVSKPADKTANSAGNSNSGNTGSNSNTPADNKPSSGGNSNGNSGNNSGTGSDNKPSTPASSGNTGNSDNKPSTPEPTKPSEPAHVHVYNIHHDAVTHTEKELVSAAYDEPVYKDVYVCNGCGASFNNADAVGEHIMNAMDDDFNTNCQGYHLEEKVVNNIHHDAVYKDVIVTDVAAYNSCSCGKHE